MLKKLLDKNPETRISAAEALRHPAFQFGCPSPTRIDVPLDNEEISSNLQEFHEKYNFGINPFPKETTPEILKSPNINKIFNDNFSNPQTPEIKMITKGPKAVSSYYQNQMKMNPPKKIDLDSIEDGTSYSSEMDENSPVIFNIQKLNQTQPGNKEKIINLQKCDEEKKKNEGKTKADLARMKLMKLE